MSFFLPKYLRVNDCKTNSNRLVSQNQLHLGNVNFILLRIDK